MKLQNALELKDVTKAYEDFLLDHISITLPKGCMMGLIGENGAGKSTTMKLILGLCRKDSGNIFVMGKDSENLSPREKEQIGVVMDECDFPENLNVSQIGRILKNIYQNWDESVFSSLIKRFDLPEKKPVKFFSKGMKTKLSIGAALCHKPKILIMDEPTSGLDPIVRDEILDLFLEFIQEEDHSILISSHIISDLEKACDYITFLHKGRLMFSEEKDMLRQRYGIFNCKKEEWERLLRERPECVKGSRISQFGAQVLVDQYRMPRDMSAEQASLEEIMLFFVKGESK